MARRLTFRSTALTGLGLLTACSNGGNVSNAAPRISAVPPQQVAGATEFSLDLDGYVTDREGVPLAYTVATGGGAFAGSVYSNTFDSMGDHTVEFTVTDGAKTTTGSFDVRVRSADFAVVREDLNGLFLVDTGTNQSLRIAASSAEPSLATGLDDGRLVYHVAGAVNQLWIYDPLTRRSARLAADQDSAAVYKAKTSDGRILYAVGTSVEATLSIYNPRTELAREIATGQLLQVMVTNDDLVFYEVQVDGQTDVYFYDPETDGSQAVGTDERAETLVTTLVNGAVVFSRVGAGGEHHLMNYRRSVGLVEVGADQSALATRDKTFLAGGQGGQVVFSAPDAGSGELFYWSPTTGQTTPIATGSDAVFDAMTTSGQVVFHDVVGSTEHDVYFYDINTDLAATVRDDSDIGQVLGVTESSGTAWAIVRASGDPNNLLAISLVATPVSQSWAAAGATATSVNVLANGDVVAARSDASALGVFDAAAGAWSTAVSGTNLVFGGAGIDAGDFVFSRTVSGQTDLSMWDASETAAITVSNEAGNEVFQAHTLSNTVLFTRVTAPNTNADLFAWNGTTVTQVTDIDSANLRHDHAVLGTYAGSR